MRYIQNILNAFFGNEQRARASVIVILGLILIWYVTSHRTEIGHNLQNTMNKVIWPLLIIAVMIYGIKVLVFGKKNTPKKK
jgi:hypothetical protein